MKRLIMSLAAAAFLAVAPQAAIAQDTPEVSTIESLQLCMSVEQGASMGSIIGAKGFTPSTKAANRWVKGIGEHEIQVSIIDKTLESGRTHRMCTIGVWGRMNNSAELFQAMVEHFQKSGYTVQPSEQKPDGSTVQTLFKAAGNAINVISLSKNDGADSSKGANYVIIYGWLM